MRGFDVLAPRLGDHYLIYGAGTMGLMMMELAKRAGAASVSMVDLNPARLETAKELGCTHTVTSADDLEVAGTTSSTAPASSPPSRTGWAA